MTTQKQSRFQGVTQLRTTLHGKLREAERKEWWIRHRRALVDTMPNPVDFECVLVVFNIQGAREIEFLKCIALQPGARQIFLETVLQSTMFQAGEEPINIAMLQLAYEDVCQSMQQNATGSTKGASGTPRKGWVYSKASKGLSKKFKRGMGSVGGRICHDS